ncbi:MAG: transposase [Verrucomicrobia bacterium]|nr:transposase [Verrucomicrobiota bacterium]
MHSYSRCWLHITWATLNRQPLLSPEAAAQVSRFLSDYAREMPVHMRINFVNADHVHVLLDLPATRRLDEAVQLLKGGSSHWINERNLVPGKFGWQRGYGAFSVSHSAMAQVTAYIAGQEEHHRKRSFAEELRIFVEKHGLVWRPGENR